MPKAEVQTVTGHLIIAQMTGVALTIGISTCIFVSKATIDITFILPSVPHDDSYARIAGAEPRLFDGLRNDIRALVLHSIANVVARVFFLDVASSALGFPPSFFYEERKSGIVEPSGET